MTLRSHPPRTQTVRETGPSGRHCPRKTQETSDGGENQVRKGRGWKDGGPTGDLSVVPERPPAPVSRPGLTGRPTLPDPMSGSTRGRRTWGDTRTDILPLSFVYQNSE